MSRPYVLTILDGWGFNRRTLGNAIRQGHTPTFSTIINSYPMRLLQASGLAVGLTWGEAGNSEVGHLGIGAGRIIQQYRTRINRAIADGSFDTNPAIVGAMEFAANNNSALHLLGLLTSGSVHADYRHILALLECADDRKVSAVYLHLFTDGKDSGLQEGAELIKDLKNDISLRHIGIIATVTGRNFGMDRDNNWDLTEQAYRAIAFGEGVKVADFESALREQYQKDMHDMKIPPMVDVSYAGIGDKDAVIFFNFREDSIRQLFKSFADDNFKSFPVRRPSAGFISSITEYVTGQTQPAAFMPPTVKNSLGEVISDLGLRQFHIAETIKYAHVTYFFNGLHQQPFTKEVDALIPSVKEIETFPTMRAHEIVARVREELSRDAYDLYVINLANADMLAHTGNYDATIIGVQTIDQAVNNLIEGVLEKDGIMLITADHGNAESLLYSETGAPESKHNDSPVALHLIANEYRHDKTPEKIAAETANIDGILGDVAPTLLEFMGIPRPEEMTGRSLAALLVKP